MVIFINGALQNSSIARNIFLKQNAWQSCFQPIFVGQKCGATETLNQGPLCSSQKLPLRLQPGGGAQTFTVISVGNVFFLVTIASWYNYLDLFWWGFQRIMLLICICIQLQSILFCLDPVLCLKTGANVATQLTLDVFFENSCLASLPHMSRLIWNEWTPENLDECTSNTGEQVHQISGKNHSKSDVL